MKTTILGDQRVEPQVKPGNRTFRMRLDPRAIGHIIEGLSSLYIDPLFATAREEISNAMDANSRVAGAAPVEVSFPVATYIPKTGPGTRERWLGRAGELVVRDYGPGMDAEDLEAYGSYGFTDKEGVNDQQGGFGLGSKSPLSFADSFKIISVKNGLRYTVQVHRDVTRVGLFEFLEDAVPVAEPNGVTVRIPITGEQSARLTQDNALRENLRGYPHGSILVNGQAVSTALDNGGYLAVRGLNDVSGWVSLNYKQQKDSFVSGLVNRTKIVLGGTLYELPFDESNATNSPVRKYDWLNRVETLLQQLNVTNRYLYLNLPLGSLHLPRSRDRIIMDEYNRDVIITAFREFFQLLPMAATTQLNMLDEPTEAAIFYANNWGLWQPGSAITKRESGSKDLPDERDAHTSWRGHELGGKITMPGTWKFYTSYIGNGFNQHGLIEEGKWPFYTALRNRLSLLENSYGGGLRRPKKDNFKLEADFVLQVPEFTDDLAARLEKIIRVYGRNVLMTENIGVLVTDNKDVGFWPQRLLPVVTWDEMIEQTKAVTKAAREVAVKQPKQTAKPLFYPTLDLTGQKLEETGAENIQPDAVYMEQEAFAPHPYTNNLWASVQSRSWKGGLDAQFAAAMRQVVGTRQVVTLPKDRSLESFVKRYAPESENITGLLITQLHAVRDGDAFRWEVFRAISKLVYVQQYAYSPALSVLAFMETLHQRMQDAGAQVTNQLLAALIRQIGGTGDLYLLLRLAQSARFGLKSAGVDPQVLRLLQPRKKDEERGEIEKILAIFTQNRNIDIDHARHVVTSLNAIMP